MSTVPNTAPRQLTWYKARQCYKKFYRGKVYYLRGDNSHEDTQANYEVALQEWAVRKRQVDAVSEETGIAKTVSETVLRIEGFTEDLRHDANKKLKNLGLPTIAPPKVETRPLGEAAEIFLDDMRTRTARGEISVGRYAKVADYIKTLLDFAGRDTDANAVTELTLQAYRKEITKRIGNGKDNQIGDYTAKYTLEAAASFVDWLWMSKLLLERPRNIGVFKHVKVEKRDVKFFTVKQVKAIWQGCQSDWQRLFVALALNTAMNQADMAHLTPQHLQPPYLVLRRGKTGVLACWKLWPVTQRLIDSCKRPKLKPSDLLFLTREGRPLVERDFRKDGRTTFKNDAVHQVFKRVLRRVGIEGTLVMLRKTVATVLKAKGYGDVVQFFLSHQSDALFLSNGVVSKEPENGSVAEVFYVGHEAKIHALKNHRRLLEALDVLEKEFGLGEVQDGQAPTK